MNVTVRRARRADARTIAEVALRLFAQHRAYDAQRFADLASIEGAENFYASQTENADVAILIVETAEKIVGFAYLEFEKTNYADLLVNAVRLHDLYVDETARGAGAGKILLEKSKAVAQKFGADKLILSVAASNKIAEEFFERNGFKTTMVEMMMDLTIIEDN